MNKTNKWIVTFAAFLVALSVGIGTAIGVTLWYHHMPAVGASQTLTPNCDPTVADVASVGLGSSGQITFECSTTLAAFSISGGSVSLIPVFVGQGFRAPYTTLWIFNADGGGLTGACSGRTGGAELQNNTSMTLSVGNYNYCAEFVDVGQSGLRGFSVGWFAGRVS